MDYEIKQRLDDHSLWLEILTIVIISIVVVAVGMGIYHEGKAEGRKEAQQQVTAPE